MLRVPLQIRDNKVPYCSPLAGIVRKEAELFLREAVLLRMLYNAMHGLIQISEWLNQCYHPTHSVWFGSVIYHNFIGWKEEEKSGSFLRIELLINFFPSLQG